MPSMPLYENLIYPRPEPPTILCTMGFARMGRIKSRLESVSVGSPD